MYNQFWHTALYLGAIDISSRSCKRIRFRPDPPKSTVEYHAAIAGCRTVNLKEYLDYLSLEGWRRASCGTGSGW
jgi:hypothetical protein